MNITLLLLSGALSPPRPGKPDYGMIGAWLAILALGIVFWWFIARALGWL